VFFTDDTVALRPLLGAANLVAAAGASVAGLVTMPLDHGARLRAGLRGALFSLPELAFVNIRKGSFTHVLRVAKPCRPHDSPIPRRFGGLMTRLVWGFR
jgi:hypothetical protein